MASVQLVYPARSDGVLEIGQDAKRQPNRPEIGKKEKTHKKGGIAWYEAISPEDDRYSEWVKKLGVLLKQDAQSRLEPAQGWSAAALKEVEWVLAELPKNYALFEHVRVSEVKATDSKAEMVKAGEVKSAEDKKEESKTAGFKQDERRDVYLYGHPGGPKKRFRSPGDFLPHLWWLLAGSVDENEHSTCPCKLCSPDEIVATGAQWILQMESNNTRIPEFAKPYAKKDKKLNVKKDAQKGVENAAPKGPSIGTGSGFSAPVQTLQLQAGEEIKSIAVNKPMELAPARHAVQQQDQQPGPFIYRSGELVWFKKPMGNLGIAAVLTHFSDSIQGVPFYTLQPLSTPLHPTQPVKCDSSNIYPWLAYSLPDTENASLRGSKKRFHEVDWESMSTSDGGVVDGSIFAARDVDGSFTLVQQFDLPGAPMMEILYNGIYLGGELIWVNEPVRFRPHKDFETGLELGVVLKIIERHHTGSKPSEILLEIDLYDLVTQSATQTTAIPPQLPPRVREDLNFRNAVHLPNHGQTFNYVLKAGQLRMPLIQIAGRWYESQHVIANVNPALFEQGMRSGIIPDCGPYLNPRGNNMVPLSQGAKKGRREEAFGGSLPRGTLFAINFENPSQGLEPPPFVQTDATDERGYY